MVTTTTSMIGVISRIQSSRRNCSIPDMNVPLVTGAQNTDHAVAYCIDSSSPAANPMEM